MRRGDGMNLKKENDCDLKDKIVNGQLSIVNGEIASTHSLLTIHHSP